MMRRSTLVAMALLLALPPAGFAQAASGVEWWGPTDIGEGFHIRVLVDVNNGLDVAVADGLVAADLDLAALLIEAGWTSAPAGDEDVLAGFHFDTESVRVVAMTDLLPRQEGTQHGRLAAVDKSLPSTDLRRYEVPAIAIEGSLAGDGAGFDAAVDPHITVLWRAPGTIAPGSHRSFAVYLDSDRTSPPHESSDLSGAAATALRSLFWSGAGTLLYGAVAPTSGAGSVQVIGLHEGTHVQIAAGPPGQPLQPLGAFTVGAKQAIDRAVTSGPPVVVRVSADKPVLALGTSAGFVPSLDATMAGTSFLVSLRHPASWEQDTLYAMAADHTKPTAIDVTRIDGDGAFTTTLNAGLNPAPYTVGARSDMSSACRPVDSQRPTPLLPASTGLYEVKVSEGGPILLQMQPVDGLFQVPALDGTPSGTRFQAATGWSESFAAAGRCVDTSRQGGYVAFAVEGTAHVNVTSPELGVQVDPPGSPGSAASAYPPARTVLEAPRFSGPNAVGIKDRPVMFRTDAPAQILAGLMPAQLAVDGANRATYGSRADPGVHGPLGGADAARVFSALGPFTVVAPFPGTRVTMQVLRESGTSTVANDLAADASLAVTHQGADLVRSARIEADRPIVVLPAMTSGYFAAIPPRLQAQATVAEFRGFLLDASSPTGLDPVAASTLPGKAVAYPVDVRNLGRGATQGLSDTAILTVDRSALPTGWTATLDRTTLVLGPGEAQRAILTVRPPPDADTTRSGAVRVVATSVNNDRVSDALQTVTTLRRSFDVGLWFDRPLDGPKALPPVPIDAGETATYRVVAMNEGSSDDTLVLELSDTTDWAQSLVLCVQQPVPPSPQPSKPCAGIPVSELTLHPGQVAWLDLNVTPPDGATFGVASTRLTARSQAAPLAMDRISAITRLAQASDLDLDAGNLSTLVLPGEEAILPLTLSNHGGSATVDLAAQAGNATGWSLPEVVVTSPSGTGTVPGQDVNVNGGTSLQVLVKIRAGADLAAGDTTSLRVVATPGEGVEREAFLLVTVAAAHRLAVTLPDLPLAVGPDGEATAEIRVSNQGNLDEELVFLAEDLPARWDANATEVLALPRGETQVVRVALRPALGAIPGVYNATLALQARDGNRTLVPLTVGIGARVGAQLGPGDALQAQPGRPAVHRAIVLNDGNVPMTVRVRPAAGEPWALVQSSERVVLAGETATIDVAWVVPRDARGTSTHRALLELQGLGDATPQDKVVEAGVDVQLAQLRLDDVQGFPGAGGTLVRATVINEGKRPAFGFVVQLSDGRVGLDNATVGVLAPGQAITVTLLQAAGGPAKVLVDPQDGVVESDESDNAASVGEAAKPAPGMAPLAAVVAMALVLAWRRRQ